jgi:hypothetical protein
LRAWGRDGGGDFAPSLPAVAPAIFAAVQSHGPGFAAGFQFLKILHCISIILMLNENDVLQNGLHIPDLFR